MENCHIHVHALVQIMKSLKSLECMKSIYTYLPKPNKYENIIFSSNGTCVCV